MLDLNETSPEILIVGAGPAGLTAAVYLARFRRRVWVIDSGASRASWIPASRNLIGFPEGIGGSELLARLREQACKYGAILLGGQVTSLKRHEDGYFTAEIDEHTIRIPRVLLATGGLDIEPNLPGIRAAVQQGIVRYCPICDAYEAIGKRVGLIAYGKCRIKEAMLLRAYTDKLTILTLGQAMEMPDHERDDLEAAGIEILAVPVDRLALTGDAVTTWHMQGGGTRSFDIIYSALGTRLRSDLASMLGAKADEDGALFVNEYQETSVSGLYAAGDVVRGLSQISVAAGQAAIAATHLNRSLPFPMHAQDTECPG